MPLCYDIESKLGRTTVDERKKLLFLIPTSFIPLQLSPPIFDSSGFWRKRLQKNTQRIQEKKAKDDCCSPSYFNPPPPINQCLDSISPPPSSSHPEQEKSIALSTRQSGSQEKESPTFISQARRSEYGSRKLNVPAEQQPLLSRALIILLNTSKTSFWCSKYSTHLPK